MAGWDKYGLRWDSAESIKSMLDADKHNLAKYLETVRLAMMERGVATGCDCRAISRGFVGDKVVLTSRHFRGLETALKTIVTHFRNHTEKLEIIQRVTPGQDTLEATGNITFACNENRNYWTWKGIVAEASCKAIDVTMGVRLNSAIISWWLYKMYCVINLCKVYRMQNWQLQLSPSGEQRFETGVVVKQKTAENAWDPWYDPPDTRGNLFRGWTHGYGPDTSIHRMDYDNTQMAAKPDMWGNFLSIWGGLAQVDTSIHGYSGIDTYGAGSAACWGDDTGYCATRTTSPGVHTYCAYGVYFWTPDNGLWWETWSPEAVKRYGYYSVTELPADFKLKIKISGEYKVWAGVGNSDEGLDGQTAWDKHEKDVTDLLLNPVYPYDFGIDADHGFNQPDASVMPALNTGWSQSGLDIRHSIESEGIADIYEPSFEFKNW